MLYRQVPLALPPTVRGRDHAEKAPPDTSHSRAPPPPHPPKVARPRLPTAPAPTYLVHTVPGTSRLPASPSQRQATSLPPSPRRTGKSLHSSFFFFLCMCISPSTSIPLHSSAISRVLLATLPLLPQPTHPPRPRVASQHVDVGTLPLPSERASEPPSALPSGCVCGRARHNVLCRSAACRCRYRCRCHCHPPGLQCVHVPACAHIHVCNLRQTDPPEPTAALV